MVRAALVAVPLVLAEVAACGLAAPSPNRAATPSAPASPAGTASPALASIRPAPGVQGRLTFDNFLDVYLLDLATGEVVQLTDASGPDQNPVWSPDGTKIAFRSRRDGSDDIFMMDADGSRQQNLTRSEDQDEWGPSWSPDGAWLAFNTSVAERTSLRLRVVRPDGSGGRFLGSAYAEFPTWSPDGGRIAFASLAPGQAGINPNYDLRAIDVDGRVERALTDTPDVYEMYPQWSPDGSRIAFMAGPRGIDNTAIWVMPVDGGDARRLTEPNTAVPAWSPDGRHIVYLDVGRDFVVMNSDGSEPVPLGLSALEFEELGFASWTR